MGIQINGQTDTVTATDGSINVGGDVTIPGVLTYEDVTSVDAVGLSTFQNGIHVTGGNIGVNNTNPQSQLHVTNSSTSTVSLMEDGSSGADLVYDGSTNYFSIKTGTSGAGSQTTRLTIQRDNGNLGINTTTPRAKLDVMSTGNFTVDGDTFDGVSLIIRNDGGTQGNGNYGSAIGFTQIGNPGVAGYRAAITSVQTGADSDQLGLAFLTHPSVTGGDDLSEAFRINADGKITINNTTPTLEFNGTQQSNTASADLLWNLRDGNGNDYDVVKITGQNYGNGGYGNLTVQTAYNNTLKDRIVVSNAGISSFIGYTANTDVLRIHDGTVQINDSLNQNNWQLQVKNTNNSFSTGNSLIRAEYTGTNSSSNIKVFSGYVTSESAETCYIAGNGQFHGRGITGERDSASILGKYHSTGGATIDITPLTANTWTILEIFGTVNPNSGGGGYLDPLHMYVYNGRGWNGSTLTNYIYTQHVAPPARDIYPSGTTNSGNIVDAVWYNGSSESDTCSNNSSSHYVRLKCYNYNSTYGSSFNVRYFIRR